MMFTSPQEDQRDPDPDVGRDVAVPCGWRDTQALMSSYQQPDEQTTREVVVFEKPAKAMPRSALALIS